MSMSVRHLAVIGSLCAFVSAPVAAQGMPPGTTVSNATLSAVFLFDTDLDSGGSYSWGSVRAAGSKWISKLGRWVWVRP